MDNYYKVLGIKQTSSASEIKKAYLEKIKKYHPDLYSGDKLFAEKETEKITEAYNTLKDAEKRQKYDRLISIKQNNQTRFEEQNKAHWQKQSEKPKKNVNDNKAKQEKTKPKVKVRQKQTRQVVSDKDKKTKLVLDVVIAILVALIVLLVVLYILK